MVFLCVGDLLSIEMLIVAAHMKAVSLKTAMHALLSLKPFSSYSR